MAAITSTNPNNSNNNNNNNNNHSNNDNDNNNELDNVWNRKLSNGPGLGENGNGPGPIGPIGLVGMGHDDGWPALSESKSKGFVKVEFGSVSNSQVTGTESPPLSPSVQLQSQSTSTYQKPTTSNLNHNPSNHGRPARQKSMKRDGNTQANGGYSHQPLSPAEGSHNPSTEGSGRDNIQSHGHRDSGSRNASGDHHQPRNSFRRGSGGSHSREGSHQNYGGRRGDQDRGNHDWNHQRSFNGRDGTMQPRVSPRGFRPQSVSAPFVHPAPMRPAFMNPMGVAEVPMFYIPGVPFVTPVPGPVFIHPAPDPQLHAKIVNQIDYYFSNENLIRDTFLRRNMDDNGWVPVALIAGFKKVMQLTENIQQILDAVRSSSVVEVQGDKIRKRDDWVKWIMPPSAQFPTASGLQSPKSPTINTLSAHIQNIKVDENPIEQNHSTGELNDNVSSQAVIDGANSSGC